MQSARIAFRSLFRARAFTATATIALALGIGLSTAVFVVANTLLVRSLPVHDQDRIAVVQGEMRTGKFANFPLLLTEVREIALRTRALTDVAFFSWEGAAFSPIRDGERLYRVRRSLVSGNFFDVMGAQAAVGRTLNADDDHIGAAPVVVISHRLWQQQFGGDRDVLSKSIVMHANGRTFRIVGVMPAGMDFPRGSELWAPVLATTTGSADSLRLVSNSFDLIGRLRPGATLNDASGELTRYFGRAGAPPLENNVRGAAHSLPSLVLGDARDGVVALSVAAALLLLLACINTANLLLVRGVGRVREFAVRTALGASRMQIIWQLIVESVVLAAIGGLLGSAVAQMALRAFVVYAPVDVPRLDEISVDANVLLMVVAVTTVATLLFAIAPAIATSRVQLQNTLRAGARHNTGNRTFRFVRELLVVAQVALAVTVLSFAGLLARSFYKLGNVDLALSTDRVTMAELTFRTELADGGQKQLALLNQIVDNVAALPQVESVTPVMAVPFDVAGGIYGRVSTSEQTPDELKANPILDMQVVAPNYFHTLGIPIENGRAFENGDAPGAPSVIVVSASTAQHYWPNANPIGKQIVIRDIPKTRFTVVGVVADTRYRDLRSARSSIYFPLRQSFFPIVPAMLAIHTKTANANLIPALRRVLETINPGIALENASTFDAMLDQPLAQPRLNAMVLSAFAGSAVVLAAIGLFGVIAATVRQRTRELGIRMALGATQQQVRRMVTTRGLAIASIGAVIGVVVAFVAGRVASSLLYDVQPGDPLTVVGTLSLILAVAYVACVVPARAGSNIDPSIALRSDE